MRLSNLCALALLATLIGCTASSDAGLEHDQFEPKPEREDVSAILAEVDTVREVSPSLDTLAPVHFLQFLDIKNGADRIVMLVPDNPSKVDKIQGYNQVPLDWIEVDDIDALFALVDDNTLTSPVYSIYANMVPESHPTTKGIEAIRLIQGFKRKQYPSLWPLFHVEDSASARLDSIKHELRTWWRDSNGR